MSRNRKILFDNEHKIIKISKCCSAKIVILVETRKIGELFVCTKCGKQIKHGNWKTKLIEGCEYV